jgi:hypothetical protein
MTSFDWREYLNVALSLAGRDVEVTFEAQLRSSASRAYFAAFGHASTYAERGGFRRTGEVRDHGRLRAHFKTKNLRVAKALEELRIWRSQCDYDEYVPNINALVGSALDRAEEVFRLLVLREN